MKSPLVIVLIALAAITLGSCKTPLDEGEVPIEEWTVKSIYFFAALNPPEFSVEFAGPTNMASNKYYYDFELKNIFDFKDVLVVPGVVLVKTSDIQRYTVSITSENGVLIQTGTQATFYDGFFYEKYTDSLGVTHVQAKIKIATRTKEITIIQ